MTDHRQQLTDLTEQLRFLHANTLPELRRNVEHEQASKARWRERAEQAEAKLAAVQVLAEDLATWCSPVGVTAQGISGQLLAVLNSQLDHSTDARKAITVKPEPISPWTILGAATNRPFCHHCCRTVTADHTCTEP